MLHETTPEKAKFTITKHPYGSTYVIYQRHPDGTWAWVDVADNLKDAMAKLEEIKAPPKTTWYFE